MLLLLGKGIIEREHETGECSGRENATVGRKAVVIFHPKSVSWRLSAPEEIVAIIGDEHDSIELAGAPFG